MLSITLAIKKGFPIRGARENEWLRGGGFLEALLHKLQYRRLVLPEMLPPDNSIRSVFDNDAPYRAATGIEIPQLRSAEMLRYEV